MKITSVARLVLFSSTVLGLAACECKGTAKDIFVNKDPNADSVVCTWRKADSIVICTRYTPAGARKDTSGLGQ